MSGERGGLVADALLETAVARDHERVVADDVTAEARPQVPLGDAHADAVRESLTERPRRHLDASRHEVLRVPRGAAAPLAELLEVLLLEPEAREVEHRVQQDRRMSVGQHEAIAVGPLRVGGVVLHDAGPEHVREGGERHRSAGMPGVRALRRVHGEAADHVDPELLDLRNGHVWAPFPTCRRGWTYPPARPPYPDGSSLKRAMDAV